MLHVHFCSLLFLILVSIQANPSIIKKWKRYHSTSRNGRTIRHVVFGTEFDQPVRCNDGRNDTLLLCNNGAFFITDHAKRSKIDRNQAVRLPDHRIYAVALMLHGGIESVESCKLKFVSDNCGSRWPVSGFIVGNFSENSEPLYSGSVLTLASRGSATMSKSDWKGLLKYFHRIGRRAENTSSSLLEKFHTGGGAGGRRLMSIDSNEKLIELTKFDSAVLTMLEVSTRLRDLASGKTRIRGKDKAPCDLGKTCVKDRSIKCTTDEDCGDKAPCDTDKTCFKDRSIKCHTDEECKDKAPCDNGRVTRPRHIGEINIYPSHLYPSNGTIPATVAYGKGDVGEKNNNTDCEDDCGDQEQSLLEVSTSINKGAAQQIASPPGPLSALLTVSITDSIVDDLSNALRRRFDDILGPKIRKAVVRSSTRALTRKLTSTVGHSLSRVLVELLTLSMTAVSTKELVRSVVPTLTASLVPVLTQSMSHRSDTDYYCYYCNHYNAYCSECRYFLSADEFRVSLGTYYGSYYSQYYSKFYTSVQDSTEDYFSRGGRDRRSKII